MMEKRNEKKIRDSIRNSSATRLNLQRVNDNSKMQSVQATGLDSEVLDNVERVQNYGFSSNPMGGEAIGLPIGGDRGHMVIVAVDDRGSRKGGGAPGDVSVYNANGDYVTLGEGNKIEIKTKELGAEAEDKAGFKTKAFSVEADEITLKAATVKIEGDLEIKGNLKVDGDITATGSITGG
jgi:phage baseplate assembly protein V